MAKNKKAPYKVLLPRKWASHEVPGHNVHIPGTTNYLRSRTFQSWFNMMVRCHYRSHQCWKDYGGRGIRVCRRWYSFRQFIADMGHRPKGMTLDRVRVNGNYTPGNCKWATLSEQNSNQRRWRVSASKAERRWRVSRSKSRKAA